MLSSVIGGTLADVTSRLVESELELAVVGEPRDADADEAEGAGSVAQPAEVDPVSSSTARESEAPCR